MLNATELRDLLGRANLSQRGAAKVLDIDERTMRRYCAGQIQTPVVVELALKHLVANPTAADQFAG